MVVLYIDQNITHKLIMLLSLCFALVFTQQQRGTFVKEPIIQVSSDTLYWRKDYKLIWDDFNCVPDTTAIGRAATVSGFITKSKYTSDSTISVIVCAAFYKHLSWVKNEYRDSLKTLNHEQRHFDITEVYARKTTESFKKYKFNKSTVNRDIDSIINYFFNKMNEMQDLYDKETTQPINYEKQREWDKKIDIWLKDTR